jgi:hypothetical protein
MELNPVKSAMDDDENENQVDKTTLSESLSLLSPNQRQNLICEELKSQCIFDTCYSLPFQRAYSAILSSYDSSFIYLPS